MICSTCLTSGLIPSIVQGQSPAVPASMPSEVSPALGVPPATLLQRKVLQTALFPCRFNLLTFPATADTKSSQPGLAVGLNRPKEVGGDPGDSTRLP